MAKIAVELERALARRARDGGPGDLNIHTLAKGDGWTVEDVVCTSGPSDRKFEERHMWYRIAVVAAGSFECRTDLGRELMTPGSLLLGNAGECFECGHEHGSGDRCVAFGYSPALFESLAEGVAFGCLRLPPIAALSNLVARACSGLEVRSGDWEEISLQIAGRALELSANGARLRDPAPSTLARISRAIRRIDHDPSQPLTLADLAEEARLSPYHFVRAFERVIGVTPYQYVRRARLRMAAAQLSTNRDRVLDIALDCGFGDISNFNRVFRAEFGMTPRRLRVHARAKTQTVEKGVWNKLHRMDVNKG